MKKGMIYISSFIITTFFFTTDVYTQVTVSGFVKTMTGVPIKGATVKLVNLNDTRKTNTEGFYDFSNTNIHTFSKKSDHSLMYKNRGLLLDLESRRNVSITLFNLIRVWNLGGYLNPNEDAHNVSIECI